MKHDITPAVGNIVDYRLGAADIAQIDARTDIDEDFVIGAAYPMEVIKVGPAGTTGRVDLGVERIIVTGVHSGMGPATYSSRPRDAVPGQGDWPARPSNWPKDRPWPPVAGDWGPGQTWPERAKEWPNNRAWPPLQPGVGVGRTQRPWPPVSPDWPKGRPWPPNDADWLPGQPWPDRPSNWPAGSTWPPVRREWDGGAVPAGAPPAPPHKP